MKDKSKYETDVRYQAEESSDGVELIARSEGPPALEPGVLDPQPGHLLLLHRQPAPGCQAPSHQANRSDGAFGI